MTAKCPAWLELKNGKFQIIKERAKVIQRIFEDSANGIGSYTIAKRLNDDKVPSFSGKPLWFESYVTKILSHRTVLGECQPHKTVNGKRIAEGEPIPNHFPPIIDDKLFNRVQHGRNQRHALKSYGRKGEGFANLFSGLVHCGYCNKKMRFTNKTHHYLICPDFNCHRVGWRYDDFETSCLTYFRELDLPSIINSGEQEKHRAKLQQEINASNGRSVRIEKKIK